MASTAVTLAAQFCCCCCPQSQLGPERPVHAALHDPCTPLQAVEELLQREGDPTGERYSLAKVLHTCQVGSCCIEDCG